MSKELDFSSADTSLRHKVFEYIKTQIIKGVYSAGDVILETKLADELGVSRTPVREAIWLLEVEGLVETTAKKGAVVLGISERDVSEIFAMRELLEGLAARWAAKRMTEEQLKELQKISELSEFYVQKGDLEELAEMDNKFHRLIYEGSGSKMLNLTLRNLHICVQQARIDSYHFDKRRELSVTEHVALVEALLRRDADAAEKAMTYHVKMAYRNIVDHPIEKE